MSAGMAGVIAAHSLSSSSETEHARQWMCQCGQFNAVLGFGEEEPEAHATHVAEELAKAGYGLLPDVAPEYGAPLKVHGSLTADPFGHGRVRDPHWWEKSTHMRLVGPWQELEPPPAPLAAALADPEGHALVKAIHDRKAEA